MSSWSDLETMVALRGPQAGSAWGKKDPGETRQARDHQHGSRRGSHRPPGGSRPRDPAPRPGPAAACSAPGNPAPGRQPSPRPAPTESKGKGCSAARPVRRERRTRRRKTFCRLRCSFSNARAAAAASAAPRFRLATRLAGPVPGESWRTKGDRDQGSGG